VYPFNRNIFTCIDFAPSEVTNRPASELNQEGIQNSTKPAKHHSETTQDRNPKDVIELAESEISDVPGPSDVNNFSPVLLRPFPKAGPRQETNKGRRKRKTCILTDTPEKKAIEEEYNNIIDKQQKKNLKTNQKLSKKVKKMTNKMSWMILLMKKSAFV
jgi:hypothetical protein